MKILPPLIYTCVICEEEITSQDRDKNCPNPDCNSSSPHNPISHLGHH